MALKRSRQPWNALPLLTTTFYLVKQINMTDCRFISTSSLFAVHFGGAEEDRTPDLLRARQALSQLSYGPEK